jgi:transketolase
MLESDHQAYLLRQAWLRLLEIKDADIRILTLEQGRTAVDRGIHIGGAFSALIPLTALYYGGFMRIDVEDPTRPGQDLFILSKGHAVAALASIYADLGFYGKDVLAHSRSAESILNGHPGPLLPGVHVSTGPEGHGLSVSVGLALGGRLHERFDVFCLTGDGELQAGMIWEGVMYAGARHLDNLCVLVDKNEGQLDNPRALMFPMPGVGRWFESFGWNAVEVDATGYEGVVEALERFRQGPRTGRPTAIICNTKKGWGGFSSFMAGHKVELPEELAHREIELQRGRRQERERELASLVAGLKREGQEEVERLALGMGLNMPSGSKTAQPVATHVRLTRAAPREKRIPYDAGRLPALEQGKEYAASWVVTQAMKEFAKSGRIVSVDADLGTTSGLEAGVGWADSAKALNVGVAESNMMCIGEAFAVLGYNAWVSTFCPFFDWRVMRRIAINWQERQEAISSGGWLSEGHNLDMVFLATAANLETRTNGATHMGNDDALVFSQIGHLTIVDLSCPNQVLAFMKWVMEGKKGLVYARILRAPSSALYGKDFRFELGKGYWLKRSDKDRACIVTSGREVYEALEAARALEREGVAIGVVDMPSLDEPLIGELSDSGRKLFIAEQNNGLIMEGLRRSLWNRGGRMDPRSVIPINTLDAEGRPHYIHSATYEQLLDRFSLSADTLARRVKAGLA